MFKFCRTNVKSNVFQLGYHFHNKVGLLAYFTISVVSSTAISIYDIGEHFLKEVIHHFLRHEVVVFFSLK